MIRYVAVSCLEDALERLDLPAGKVSWELFPEH